MFVVIKVIMAKSFSANPLRQTRQNVVYRWESYGFPVKAENLSHTESEGSISNHFRRSLQPMDSELGTL